MEAEPIVRMTFDAAELLKVHPPKLRNRNKQAVFEIACPQGTGGAGSVTYSRWWAMSLPRANAGSMRLTVYGREDVYDYAPLAASRSPTTSPGGAAPTDVPGRSVEWHVNFADPALFVAYGTGLFAQDEMQVAEHPVLGSLVEALRAAGERAVTAEAGVATPVLVSGAERRVRVETDANEAEGRPQGLYGNRFAAAPIEAVRRATMRIDPPTITNLIAIAAPHGGGGAYSVGEIRQILTTAYTGFRAAVVESRRVAGTGGDESVRVVVHSGMWGCGAFGGNRVLMSLLQIVAARWAGVSDLVLHTFDAAGSAAVADAKGLFDGERLAREGTIRWDGVGDAAAARGPGGGIKSLLTREVATSDQVIERVARSGYRWGVSDGN